MNFIVLDIESTGLSWQTDRLHGVAFCADGHAEYFTADKLHQKLEEAVYVSPIVGHNVRFDLKFLHKAGFRIPKDFHDTRVLAHLLDENNETGLKDLVRRYLGEHRLADKAAMDSACGRAGVRNIAELCALDLDGNEKFPPGSFTEVIAKYAIEDARNTYDLFNRLCDLLGQDEQLVRYYQEEAQPFERVLLDMELRGVRVDSGVLDTYGQELRQKQAQLEADMTTLCAAEINAVEEELYEKAKEKRKSSKGKESVLRRSDKYSTKFLFSSSKHTGELLYTRLGVGGRQTAKGNWDTSEATLAALKESTAPKAKAFLELFSEWRGVQKNLSTYVDGMKERIHNGRIHSSYGQYTVTGRTHSSDPNMQNIPRGSVVKRAFVPADGNCLVYFDYSQIELRIAAHLSQDETMLQWFRLGIDPHQDLANKIGADRQVGKTMNFLTIYDGKQGRLHDAFLQAGITKYSVDDCKELLAQYWEQVPGYRSYLDAQLRIVRDEKALRSATGRMRRLPDIEYGNGLDWRSRVFRGSGQLVEGLRAYTGEYLAPAELFERASIRYSHAKKQAFNFPIQHLGATIMKRALMELRNKGYDVVTSVHDSATIELPIPELARVSEITKIAENAMKLSVPLKVDVKILNSLDEKDLLSSTHDISLVS